MFPRFVMQKIKVIQHLASNQFKIGLINLEEAEAEFVAPALLPLNEA